uniref:Invasion protein IalB, involved in pathogenesis n=1 Tax=Candidatus Kentrum eta TaxID=2126337 RepID=A0A450UIW7_9GAMM|nr:MAG: Invasion protein IalB, involved in pathogenesis [Candidatus Kentron sp. H]VFJ92491.1 MAG: Invasion protein IalB, involved in pathogenesis [Candidatus Kentron sp. H]VFJ99273.1 MAG: Invasion protein IalB, involved in pathogenesis [Candidatus Kentron sp. H]
MKQTMHSVRIAPVLVAVFLSIGLLAFGAGNVFGEEKAFTSSTHGDWVLRCPKEKDPEKERPCTLTQQVKAEKATSPIVTIVFVHAGNPSALHVILRLPLGVALPPGIGLRIDEGEVSQWRFNHCEPAGCLVTSKVSPELRKKLQAGIKANIGFHTLGGQKVTVPASLRGITAGFNALEKK